MREAASTVHALADGDSDRQAQFLEIPLTPYIRGPEIRSLWRMRSAQIAADAAAITWVTRIIVARDDTAAVVGLAGFHGPPDERGMVEIGYRIDPSHRRRGFARSALETLLDVAGNDPRVDVVRATVGPSNVASKSLIDQFGFVEMGEQWDEEDGREIILERPA